MGSTFGRCHRSVGPWPAAKRADFTVSPRQIGPTRLQRSGGKTAPSFSCGGRFHATARLAISCPAPACRGRDASHPAPPAQSRTSGSRIRLPPWMCGVKAFPWVRMQNTRVWNPSAPSSAHGIMPFAGCGGALLPTTSGGADGERSPADSCSQEQRGIGSIR
jgi:hypothetical protein